MYKYTNKNYSFGKPPIILRKVKLDNIAIVPASMLPFKKTWQEVANNLPQGAVLLYHSQGNIRQKKLLEKVAELLKVQGHAVTNLAI